MTPAGPGALDSILNAPIKVKRRKRYGRTVFLILLFCLLVTSSLFVLRVFLMPYPAYPNKVELPGDGWKVLRGMVNLTISDPEDPAAVRQIMSDAFAARLDFLVLSESGGLALKNETDNAPLAVLLAQDIQSASGGFLALGADRAFGPGELEVGALFERVRKQKGWSMVVRATDREGPWTGWDDLTPDALEFINARTMGHDLPVVDQLAHWTGWLLGLPAGLDYLGRRPKGDLAHWDDYSQRHRVLGLCGVDSSHAGFRAPLTYVYVQEGLGPYGPSEVERALRAGHHFCSVDTFADPSGFRFMALPADGGPVLGTMGDRVDLGMGVELVADLNLEGQPDNLFLVLYQDGRQVMRHQGSRLSYKTTEQGTYRIEALVETSGFLLDRVERVFLYSNPIFVAGSDS